MSPRCRAMVALLALAYLALVPSVWAQQETVYSAAKRQDPLGNEWQSARVAALGTAFVGLADDAEAVWWNPAGLADLERFDLCLSHTSWLGQVNQEGVAFAFPVRGLGGFGFSGQYVGYGTFDGRDFFGYAADDYTANQMGLGVAWGHKLVGPLAGGLGLHGTQQTFAVNSTTLVGCDAGLLLSFPSGWRVGAAFVNQGIGRESRELASSMRLGASRRWVVRDDVTLLGAVAGEIKPNIGKSVQAGLEAGYRGMAFFRAGYSHPFQKTDYQGFSGLSLGAGFVLRGFRVDYAFVPYGGLGATHRVSLGYGWGGPKAVATSLRPMVTPAPTFLPTTLVTGVPTVFPTQVPTAVPTPMSSPVAPQPVGTPPGYPTPIAVPSGAVSGTERTLTMEFELSDSGPMDQAKTLVQQGRWIEAVKVYRDILLKDRSNAAAWRALGDVYYHLDKRDYAIQCYGNYLKLRPDDWELAAWLERYKAVVPVPTPSKP